MARVLPEPRGPLKSTAMGEKGLEGWKSSGTRPVSTRIGSCPKLPVRQSRTVSRTGCRRMGLCRNKIILASLPLAAHRPYRHHHQKEFYINNYSFFFARTIFPKVYHEPNILNLAS